LKIVNRDEYSIGSEQDAKPAAWLRLTHYTAFTIIDIQVEMPNSLCPGSYTKLQSKVEFVILSEVLSEAKEQ